MTREPIPIEQLPELGEAKIAQLRLAAARRRRREKAELDARRGVTRAQKEGFVTLGQACAILGVGETSVRTWARRAGIRRDLDKGWYDAAAIRQEALHRGRAGEPAVAPESAVEPRSAESSGGLPEAW